MPGAALQAGRVWTVGRCSYGASERSSWCVCASAHLGACQPATSSRQTVRTGGESRSPCRALSEAPNCRLTSLVFPSPLGRRMPVTLPALGHPPVTDWQLLQAEAVSPAPDRVGPACSCDERRQQPRAVRQSPVLLAQRWQASAAHSRSRHHRTSYDSVHGPECG